MDKRYWAQLQESFDSLVDLQPAAQERALRNLYNDNPGLADELRGLLEEDASGRELPAMHAEGLLVEALQRDELESRIQSQIGRYRILRLLGEGGMGVVYLAERTDISGRVAIKLLRDAWLSPVRRQRFAVEQQMLALLNHPSVARIYDTGTTTDGTPWFVMEFADGVTITEYLRASSKTAREKVKLFRAVCEAVRYAHSHAIIHRDLKPSNILVTENGGIKLLDFGIAKQMDLVDRGGNATTMGTRLFTPAYAAPELQSENQVGVFTDIYSLGVILYQMLTGSLPYPDGWIADREPQKPSHVGKGNRTEWADLDALCMKALEREPDRRYGSMDAFLQDIDAYLEDRPLQARKNAFLYTAGKFARRNRAVLLSLACTLLLLVTGTVFFTVRLARARNAAAHARDMAVAEAAHSARIQRFTESLFTGGQQSGVPPPAVKVTQMLDRGRTEALSLTGDPQLQTDMFRVLGLAYLHLHRIQDAEPLLRRAEQGSCTATASLACAQVKVALSDVRVQTGTFKAGDEVLLQNALHMQQAILPANDPVIAATVLKLGWAQVQLTRRTDALRYFTQALGMASAAGHPTPILADTMAAYGEYAFRYSDPRAMEYEQRAAEMYKQLFGPKSFEYAYAQHTLGRIAMNLGRYGQAEAYYRHALASVQAWSGPDQLVTVGYAQPLAFLLSLEGKYDEAKALLLQTLALLAQSGEAPNATTGDAYFYLGFIELKQGRLGAAEAYFNRMLALAREHVMVTEANVQTSRLGLADIYARRGDFKRSEAISRQALATGREEGDYGATAAHALLGRALLKERRLREAELELHKAYVWFSHDPTIRPQTVETYRDLAETEQRLGKPQDAARIRAELRAHPRR